MIQQRSPNDNTPDELADQRASAVEPTTLALEALRPPVDLIRQVTASMEALRPSVDLIRQVTASVEALRPSVDFMRQVSASMEALRPPVDFMRQVSASVEALRPPVDFMRQMSASVEALRPSVDLIRQMVRDTEILRAAVEARLRMEAARRGVSLAELRDAILEDVLIVWDEELLEDLQEALAWTLYELGELQTWAELLPHIPPSRRFGVGYVEGSEEPFRPLISGIFWGKRPPKHELN